jgi:hypothetical protein
MKLLAEGTDVVGLLLALGGGEEVAIDTSALAERDVDVYSGHRVIGF